MSSTMRTRSPLIPPGIAPARAELALDIGWLASPDSQLDLCRYPLDLSDKSLGGRGIPKGVGPPEFGRD